MVDKLAGGSDPLALLTVESVDKIFLLSHMTFKDLDIQMIPLTPFLNNGIHTL